MASNVIEVEAGRCACESGPSLAVLADVQRAYEERMERIERAGGANQLQKQVLLLQQWVGDLVAQNSLLARTVEDLEMELTARVLSERRKFTEVVSELRAETALLRQRLARKDGDLRGLLEVLRRLRELDCRTIDTIHFNEVTQSDIFGPVNWTPKLFQGDSDGSEILKKQNNKKEKTRNVSDQSVEMKMKIESQQREIFNKEREVRRLCKDVQQYEQTITTLKKEMSTSHFHAPEVSKKNASMMTEACSAKKELDACGGQGGDSEPVKERVDRGAYHLQIHHMESSGESVRALRETNVSLTEEVQALHRVCAALDEQCRVAALRAQFKDEIIREMRRQLRQAKAKLKGSGSKSQESNETRALADLDMSPNWICHNARYDGSGDEASYRE